MTVTETCFKRSASHVPNALEIIDNYLLLIASNAFGTRKRDV